MKLPKMKIISVPETGGKGFFALMNPYRPKVWKITWCGELVAYFAEWDKAITYAAEQAEALQLKVVQRRREELSLLETELNLIRMGRLV